MGRKQLKIYKYLIKKNMEYGEPENVTDEVLEINKKKKDFKIELALFLVLGFLLGITFKTEATKRITMGYEDYMITPMEDSYDISAIKNKVTEKIKESQDAQVESNVNDNSNEIPVESQ